MQASYAKPLAGLIYTVFADPGKQWQDLGDTICRSPWTQMYRIWKWIG